MLAAMLDEFGPVFLLVCWLAKFGVSLIRVFFLVAPVVGSCDCLFVPILKCALVL